jgi:hypothetical protein
VGRFDPEHGQWGCGGGRDEQKHDNVAARGVLPHPEAMRKERGGGAGEAWMVVSGKQTYKRPGILNE